MTPGASTANYFLTETMNLDTGIDTVHVPYKGSSELVNDLIGGQVQYTLETPGTTLPLIKQGKLGPVARLMPTSAAMTLRKDGDPPLVLDGPFAETKEQLLGFYIVDCADMEEALAIARDLGRANPGGAYEIRPVGIFFPSTATG